jgi:hypothetical protein
MAKKTKCIDVNDFINQLNHPLEEIIEEVKIKRDVIIEIVNQWLEATLV